MKISFRLLLIFLLTRSQSGHSQKTYILISKNSGKLNNGVIAALPPSLKAMAALYAAMGGTGCMDQQCALTTALGLGNQGSDAQKKLILDYFPEDKAAKLVVGQDCYLPPAGSASFSNFTYLAIVVLGSEVQVRYELDVLNHGNIKKIMGPDIYLYSNQKYKNKKRVLYAWTSK
jgi:hypothetical protein